MGAALARVGLPGAQRDFIRWYSGFQAEDGNLPDCADASGCEWLPEYDCWGQLIFAVMDYYRFSGDTAFLAEMWPAVLKSVDYMEALRKQRMTPEYQTPEKARLLRTVAGVHESRGLYGPPGPCLLGRFLGDPWLQGCRRDGRDSG